jgi:hypothetical protein
MNLATKLDKYFPASIQAQGRNYFWQRRVTIRYGSDSEVEAQVKGTYAHEVNLYWTDGRLIVWCDCNDFVERDVSCRHLWAAILAADAKGPLTEVVWATEVMMDMDDFLDDIFNTDQAVSSQRSLHHTAQGRRHPDQHGRQGPLGRQCFRRAPLAFTQIRARLYIRA